MTAPPKGFPKRPAPLLGNLRYAFRFPQHTCTQTGYVPEVFFIDPEAREIMYMVASVRSVCVSVRALLFEPFDLDFWHGGRP